MLAVINDINDSKEHIDNNLIYHPGYSFHFWSVYTGILLRRYFFNYADFDRVDPVQVSLSA